MCSILSHLTKNGSRSVLNAIPELPEKLSNESNKYFSRVILLSSEKFKMKDERSFKFSIRQVNQMSCPLFHSLVTKKGCSSTIRLSNSKIHDKQYFMFWISEILRTRRNSKFVPKSFT